MIIKMLHELFVVIKVQKHFLIIFFWMLKFEYNSYLINKWYLIFLVLFLSFKLMIELDIKIKINIENEWWMMNDKLKIVYFKKHWIKNQ
jgi:hypothetical protein